MTLKLSLALFTVAVVAVTAAARRKFASSHPTSSRSASRPAPAGAGAGGAPMETGNGVIFGTDHRGRLQPAGPRRHRHHQPARRAAAARHGRRPGPIRIPRHAGRPLQRDGHAARDGSTARTAARGPAGPTLPLALADGERVSNVNVPMWRYATIAGTVVDESGDPLVNMPVRVLKRTTVGGKMRAEDGEPGHDRRSRRLPRRPARARRLRRRRADAAAFAEMPFGAGRGRDARSHGRDAPWPCQRGRRRCRHDAHRRSTMGNGPSAGVGEDGRPLAFATMFYPNVTGVERARTAITVASGEERGCGRFPVAAPCRFRSVSGIATGPDGPVANLQITLVPAEADDTVTSIEMLNGFTDEQGRFTIEGVPPGHYMLRAVRMPRMAMGGPMVRRRPSRRAARSWLTRDDVGQRRAAPLPTDPTLWAEMTLAVGTKDLTDLAVGLRPGIKMTGSVQFNGIGRAARVRPADRFDRASSLEPADPRPGVGTGSGRVESVTGKFATVGVPPGSYFVRVKAAFPNWSLQSAMADGRDASVVPIDFESADLAGVTINFTDHPTELSGQVTADGPARWKPRRSWCFRPSRRRGSATAAARGGSANTRADKQGNFKITDLPAGDYLAIAIPDKMANDWQNPKFLESLVAEATRVRVRDNEKVTASLKVAR